MSHIIRAVRSPWLAPPTVDSNDVEMEMPKNTYRLAQIAIEAAERAQQRNINRLIRAGRQNTLPAIASPVRPLPMIASVITLPLSR